MKPWDDGYARVADRATVARGRIRKILQPSCRVKVTNAGLDAFPGNLTLSAHRS